LERVNLLRHQTFRREEDVRESFQRLHPLRIATMHARLLTQDDEVFLSVEVNRIPLHQWTEQVSGISRYAKNQEKSGLLVSR
jgi:hypothetical protein